MKNIIRICPVFISGVFLIIFLTGCTPGNSLTRGDDYNRGYQEDYADGDYAEENNEFGDDEAYSRTGANRRGNMDSPDRDQPDNSYAKSRYYQTGMASWYGREFHGKVTASGEKFDMYGYTAAHKTLPFGTVVEIKNMKTGKTVRVKINDRGPYRGKRIVDLSYNAAKKIGMIDAGEAYVGIKILKKGNGQISSDQQEWEKNDLEPVSDDLGFEEYNRDKEYTGNYKIQIGAFYSRMNAEGLKRKAESITERNVVIVQENDLYKVRVEGIRSRNDLERIKRMLSDEDIPAFLIDKQE